MDFKLQVFCVVAEEKSFSNAAKKFYITQPAVSILIRNLEEEHGVKLFERSSKFVRLTLAGDILYLHAKEILKVYSRARQLINDKYHTAQGSLSIGSGFSYGEYILPKTLALFIQNYPNVKPKVTIKNSKRIIDQILRHELDVGVIDGEFFNEKIKSEVFSEDEMVLIVSPEHHLAKRKEIQIKDLDNEVWLLRENGSGTRDYINREFEKINLVPNLIMEFGSTEIIKGAVEAGLGISLISKWAIQKEINLNILVPLIFKNISFKRNIYCITHKSQFNTKTTNLFVSFLKINLET